MGCFSSELISGLLNPVSLHFLFAVLFFLVPTVVGRVHEVRVIHEVRVMVALSFLSENCSFLGGWEETSKEPPKQVEDMCPGQS